MSVIPTSVPVDHDYLACGEADAALIIRLDDHRALAALRQLARGNGGAHVERGAISLAGAPRRMAGHQCRWAAVGRCADGGLNRAGSMARQQVAISGNIWQVNGPVSTENEGGSEDAGSSAA